LVTAGKRTQPRHENQIAPLFGAPEIVRKNLGLPGIFLGAILGFMLKRPLPESWQRSFFLAFPNA
jgi:hypothetical protein